MKPVDDASRDYRVLVARGYDACGADLSAARPGKAADVLGPLLQRLPEHARVLDLGCGSGVPITRTLAERFDVTGIDISHQQVARAAAAVPAASFAVADMSAWPFAADAFDAIVSFYAVFHVPRDAQPGVFAAIHRSLKPGAYLLASVGRTDSGSYTEQFFGVEMYWSHYDAETYRQMVRNAGFDLLDEGTLPHGYVDDDHEPELHPLIFAQKSRS